MRGENDLAGVRRLAFDRRRALKLFATAGIAGAAAPALAACSPQAAPTSPEQTLRVGLIVPQSGPLQEVGFEMLNGFSLYVNQTGKQLGGSAVVTQTIDEGPTAATGVAAVRAALKSRSYDVLVGIANSDVMAQIVNDVTAARIPLLGTNGSPADLALSAYIWRTSFVAGEASRALADYLTRSPAGKSTSTQLRKPSSVVVYHDGSNDSITEAKAFTDGLGDPSITTNTVTTGNLSSAMSQIASWNPDLVYAAVAVSSAPAFSAAYRQSGIGSVLCGPGSLTEQSKQAPAARGIFTSMNYGPGLDNEANETFTSGYLSANGGQIPTTYAMTTYDAGTVLDAAVGKIVGDITPQAINTSLGSALAFDSPRGRWGFNQTRTPLQGWYLRQVQLDGTVLDNAVLADLEPLT